jgi:large subunit ribosomal protein L31
MQANIHPAYHQVNVTCSCGNKFTIQSASGSDSMTVDVCNKCHPAYTGKQRDVDAGGRLSKFKQRYSKP